MFQAAEVLIASDVPNLFSVKTLRPGRSTARKTEGTAGRWCYKRQNPKAMGWKI